MKFTRYSKFLALVFVATSLLTLGAARAEELSYDRYASILRKEPEPSTAKEIAKNFLTYPLELLRWPIDKTLNYVDKHRLLKKGQWLYEEGVDYGFTPRFDGMDYDFVRITRQKVRFPDLVAKAWTDYTYNAYVGAGGRIGAERIAETPIRFFETMNYSYRPREHFYGIGPDTSAGEGVTFKEEETFLESDLGYSRDPSFALDFKFAYRDINIENGRDGGVGNFDDHFPTLPSHGGDKLLTYGLEWVRDTRNQQENSTHGSRVQLASSFNDGLNASDAQYFKYAVDASKYFPLWSERRILVLHFYGEHNSETSHSSVPFHQMARLGGYGSFPDLSRTLRGYEQNRFFDDSSMVLNAEYRYAIYQHRDAQLDTILFWDEGQVFGHFGEMQFQDFRGTFGMGFRFSYLNHHILTVEMAHGAEGTNFYVKSRTPF